MNYALSARSREALQQFARVGTAFAFDFDGTLAAIVSHPRQARMRRSTRCYLGRLAETQSCVVLSGRSRADLREKLRGTGVDRLVGNHGAESGEPPLVLRRQIEEWERELRSHLPDLPGVWIENKGASLTIHYRQCPRKKEARGAIGQAVQGLHRARILGGKDSVNVVPPGAPDKGAALRRELRRLGCDRAVFVGDEETDEDVFAIRNLALFTVRVGMDRRSKARYFLRRQAEIDEFLRRLVELPPCQRLR